MNDFFLAVNQCKSIAIGDAQIEVRQFLVKELVQFDFFGSKLKAALNADFSKENIKAFLDVTTIPVMCLISIVTDLTPELLSQIKLSDEDKYVEIVKEIIEVNSSYFDQKEVKESSRLSKEPESTWFDALQILVSHGHKHDDILNYNFGTYIEYLKAVSKLKNLNALETACITRTAYHADKKGFDGFAKSMKQTNT